MEGVKKKREEREMAGGCFAVQLMKYLYAFVQRSSRPEALAFGRLPLVVFFLFCFSCKVLVLIGSIGGWLKKKIGTSRYKKNVGLL